MESGEQLRHMTAETDSRYPTLVRVFTDLIYTQAAESAEAQFKILDVGSFSGNLIRDIEHNVSIRLTEHGQRKNLMVVALDPLYQTEDGLNPGQLAAGGPYVTGKGETLPFADGTFDLVTEIDAAHHADYPQAVLRDMHRVLKPGGRMIVKDHDPDSFIRVVQAGLGDVRGNVSDPGEQLKIFTTYLANLFRHGKEYALASPLKGSSNADPRLTFRYLTPAMWERLWDELKVDVVKKPFWYDYLPRQLAWLDLRHCLYVLKKPAPPTPPTSR